MSSISKGIRKTALDRKMDRIRALEESGKLGTKLTNRTLRKLLANKLAVFGAIMLLSSVFSALQLLFSQNGHLPRSASANEW